MPQRCSQRLMSVSLSVAAAILASGCGRADPGEESNGTSPAEAASKADEFDDCAGAGWCPPMVRLAGGPVVVGSPKSEPERFDDEDQKTVTIEPFAIGKYPVTRAQWSSFVEDTKRPVTTAPCAYAPSPHPTWKDPGYPQTENDPVVCVTWEEAHEYARWLSKKTGHRYRLPTDEEWEYAARGGTKTAFPWGPRASHAFANYGLDECCGPAASGPDRWEYTSPVGSFPPNPFGLYDMHGNVTEWVETCADAFEKLPLRKDGKGCTYRYARGGVYADRPALMRSAAKNLAPPPDDAMTIENYRSAGFGLRVARED